MEKRTEKPSRDREEELPRTRNWRQGADSLRSCEKLKSTGRFTLAARKERRMFRECYRTATVRSREKLSGQTLERTFLNWIDEARGKTSETTLLETSS